jgi:hypothetical protein
VNYVPDDQCNLWWNRFNCCGVDSGVLDLGYRVQLRSDNIGLRFLKSQEPLIQIADVLFGPSNFESDTMESVHGQK